MYINFLENQLSGPSFALLRFNSNVSFQNGRTDIVEAHETQPVSKQILNVTRVNCVETMNCLFEYFSYLPRRQKENINWWAQVFRASQIFLKNFLRSLNDGASLTSDPSTLILEISTLNDLTCLTRRLSKLTFCLKLAIMRQKDGQKWTPPPPPLNGADALLVGEHLGPLPGKNHPRRKKKSGRKIAESSSLLESLRVALRACWINTIDFCFSFFFQGNIRNEGAGFHQLRGASRREVILKDLDLNRAPQKTEATG